MPIFLMPSTSMKIEADKHRMRLPRRPIFFCINKYYNVACNLRYLILGVKNQSLSETGLIDFWETFDYVCCRQNFWLRFFT